MTVDERSDLEIIIRFAAAEAAHARDASLTETIRDLSDSREIPGEALVGHLDTEASVKRYQRKANHILKHVPTGRLLDWGSFYGQMTFLLVRRGLDVVPFEIEENRRERTLNDLIGRPTVYSRDLVRLPFDNNSFDAVLSSGTLEHVTDQEGSLAEIRRVLRPQGHFLIYNLPNILSWIEAINQIRGNAHARRYFLPRAIAWMRREGFEVEWAGYENVLPCSFSSIGCGRGALVHALTRVRGLDPWLETSRMTRWLATNLTLICKKR